MFNNKLCYNFYLQNSIDIFICTIVLFNSLIIYYMESMFYNIDNVQFTYYQSNEVWFKVLYLINSLKSVSVCRAVYQSQTSF